jgi:hypothetical protein
VAIVELAITVTDLLDPATVGGVEAATDLKAAAFGALGNTRRVASDLPGAREALDDAWRLNAEGAGHPLDRAHLLSLEASYLRTVGEFETAEHVLRGALTLHTAAVLSDWGLHRNALAAWLLLNEAVDPRADRAARRAAAGRSSGMPCTSCSMATYGPGAAATPKAELQLIEQRLKRAREDYEQWAPSAHPRSR